jgi:hypothetical protein
MKKTLTETLGGIAMGALILKIILLALRAAGVMMTVDNLTGSEVEHQVTEWVLSIFTSTP